MNDVGERSCAKFGRPCEKFVTRFTQKKMAGDMRLDIIWAFGERSLPELMWADQWCKKGLSFFEGHAACALSGPFS